MNRWMVPPLPAASRPLKTMTCRAPARLRHFWSFRGSVCKRRFTRAYSSRDIRSVGHELVACSKPFGAPTSLLASDGFPGSHEVLRPLDWVAAWAVRSGEHMSDGRVQVLGAPTATVVG